MFEIWNYVNTSGFFVNLFLLLSRFIVLGDPKIT